jgi:hypothetical protein
MVTTTKKEYLEKIRERYRRAGRKYKKRILDEFCEVCGHHRKHAIRLLNEDRRKRKKRPGRAAEYGTGECHVLKGIWLASNKPCSKRMKTMIPIWLPHYEKEHGDLAAEIKEKLHRISPRSIDRLLKPVRKRYGSRGLCGTRPGSMLKNEIPIKTRHWDIGKPGFVEADTVAHCGTSLEGDFVWSLTFTDIYSGWTENRATWNKGSGGVCEQIKDIEEGLPFELLGFHCDNGSEFLNHHLWKYFTNRKEPVDMTRSRPYRSNDNAHVEQKNWTHVRLLLGYQRIDDKSLLPKINHLYGCWSLFNNFFNTSFKIREKIRVGSKYQKKYDEPQTPYLRLMESSDVTEVQKTYLTELYSNLNPFDLKRQIDHYQKEIMQSLR